jgi:hypothetical protein
MKSITQVSKECNIDSRHVYNLLRKEGIVKSGIYVNKHQEDLIHQILYFEGKITEITLESKMNADVHP